MCIQAEVRQEELQTAEAPGEGGWLDVLLLLWEKELGEGPELGQACQLSGQ